MSAGVALRPDPELSPAELSPARAELARSIQTLAAAQAAYDEARRPHDRLHGVILEHDAASAELARLRAEDETALAEWIAAGAESDRPEPSAATVAAERRLAGLARDAAAARTAIPDAHRRVEIATEAVRAAHRARDAALFAVAGEAPARVASDFTAALNAALVHEAKLIGLAEELQRRGAAGAAGRVREAIRQAKAVAGVPHNLEPGRQLLAALVADPSAEL